MSAPRSRSPGQCRGASRRGRRSCRSCRARSRTASRL
jgi:hypothetical protein